ncbi:ATP-binding protein [Pedococcus sp. 2YAF34]|uniref:ATP-binding protein n=1 Tax=Pedococcus sp. 2YAF34 TaxID=3233032 RepID=UPI003F948AE7
MDLVEREPQLEQLRAALRRATDEGSVVAVAGEAGAGKSALVRAATSDQPWSRVARGLCDPLDTPRPLGPVRDVLSELGTAPGQDPVALAALGERLLSAAADEPTTVVIEDAQWIDEASVDVLRFVARRIELVPLVLVITYREGEIGPRHSLRPLLGDLARLDSAATIHLAGLSVDAIRGLLQGTPLDAVTVWALTAGNPFFVTEIARHPAERLPTSVRDAVLAGTSAVDADDLEVLQLLATAPDGVDDRLFPHLGVDVPQLRRLEGTGLLRRSRRGVVYRHELARLAVEGAIPAGVAASLHARVLEALERLGGSDPAVLAHHAHASGDEGRTLRYADRAALDAALAGSHREAVSFLELAAASTSDPQDRAALLERLSFQLYMVSRLPEALAVIIEASRLWEEVGDQDGLSAAHNRRALIEYYLARRAEAQCHVEAAVAHASSPTHGSARAMQMFLAYRRNALREARSSGAVVRAIASERRDEELRLRADIVGAAADLVDGSADARERLLDLSAEAASRGFDETASTGWSQLAAIDVEQRRLRDAERLLDRSLPFTVERDIPICNQWQTGVRSRLQLERGRWEAALEDARSVLDGGAPIASLWPHLVSALVPLRRGDAPDDGVQDHLERAWRLAQEIDEPLALLAVTTALAERAWLLGSGDPRLEMAATLVRDAGSVPGVQWASGQLALWLGRLGLDPGAVGVAEPARLQLDGRTDEAAEHWRALGAPYERALAALDSLDEGTAVAALADLETMGAWATAQRGRDVLRARGLAKVPARRRVTTVANPAGLTSRQLDVARLVAEGLTNSELAQRLYISTRTADHHVSAVLAKLGLATRRDVVRQAADLGLV